MHLRGLEVEVDGVVAEEGVGGVVERGLVDKARGDQAVTSSRVVRWAIEVRSGLRTEFAFKAVGEQGCSWLAGPAIA